VSGGKREGAGRKRMHPMLKKEPINLKLPRWLLDWLGEQPKSRAVLIEDALKAHHKIQPPECGE